MIIIINNDNIVSNECSWKAGNSCSYNNLIEYNYVLMILKSKPGIWIIRIYDYTSNGNCN